MELFGFGTPSELANPLGQRIKAATDNLLMVPDWSRNVEICDEINSHIDQIDVAKRAILRRLHDHDTQTVFLTLVLLETCMKNCGSHFAASFDKTLMEEVVKIARGLKGLKSQEQALKLIQEWARAFEQRKQQYPLFFDTYMAMKAKGVIFPREEGPVTGYDYQQPRTTSRDGKASRQTNTPSQQQQQQQNIPPPGDDPFDRLQQDMGVVMEKVRLCREILQVTSGIENDEALADVIGFLEACRDRMVEVIEAGTQGLLGEQLFSLCLKVNDAIARTLEAERTGQKLPLEEEENNQKPSESKSENNLLDLASPTPAMAMKQQEQAPAQKLSAAEEVLALSATTTNHNTTPSHIQNTNISTEDPFTTNNDPFAISATSTTTTSSVPSSNNPFDDAEAQQATHTTTTAALPPPAPTTTAGDDFDALFGATTATPGNTLPVAIQPTIVPATTTTTNIANANTTTADDFDAFFASLEKK